MIPIGTLCWLRPLGGNSPERVKCKWCFALTGNVVTIISGLDEVGAQSFEPAVECQNHYGRGLPARIWRALPNRFVPIVPPNSSVNEDRRKEIEA